MNKSKYIILVIIIIIVAIIAVLFRSLNKNTFEGKVIQNENEFSLEYSFFNKTISHTMNIKEDMSIYVNIVNISGTIDVIISDDNRNEIYRGNKINEGNNFTINIQKTGDYTFIVKGNNAEGSVLFDIN